jgi:Domain of unknown function (DUF3576)
LGMPFNLLLGTGLQESGPDLGDVATAMVQTCHSQRLPRVILRPCRTIGPAIPRLNSKTPGHKKAERNMFGIRSKIIVMLLAVGALSACGGIGSGGSGFGGGGGSGFGGIRNAEISQESRDRLVESGALPDPNRQSIFDLFTNNDDPNTTVEVNRYIWNAALEILDFMPIEAADPFSGVIVYGYGTPPGGGRAYRATVYVTDPALDARSLRVALQSRGGGAVSRDTARAVEDAILTRARQIRIREGDL